MMDYGDAASFEGAVALQSEPEGLMMSEEQNMPCGL
jgi:hypothetical protein